MGQIPPGPGEYDKNGCLSGDRVSGACEGFYAQKGPIFDGKQCCYVGCTGPVAPCGRPLVVDGRARVAETAARDDWGVSQPFELSSELRRELGEAWRKDALVEHASIASFSRFVLELMALGAPPHLISGAISAAEDEVKHAELCFGLARGFDGRDEGPGMLDVSGIVPRTSLGEVVASVIEEACCAETAGALLAARQLDAASDPSVKEALLQIAEDEARHAELGWAFVGWALARAGDELLPTVVAAFDRGVEQLRAAPIDAASPESSAFGRLSREEVREVIDSAIASVIRPTRSRLLGSIGDA